jgi:hypothetical protein
MIRLPCQRFILPPSRPPAKDASDNAISKEQAKLLKKLHINGCKGLRYYTLLHTFRTSADQAKNQPAGDLISGREKSLFSVECSRSRL